MRHVALYRRRESSGQPRTAVTVRVRAVQSAASFPAHVYPSESYNREKKMNSRTKWISDFENQLLICERVTEDME